MSEQNQELYKIKHSSGRILGPLDLERISKLILKNQLKGDELGKRYPDGEWVPLVKHDTISKLFIRSITPIKSSDEFKPQNTVSSLQSSYKPILSENNSRDPLKQTVIIQHSEQSHSSQFNEGHNQKPTEEKTEEKTIVQQVKEETLDEVLLELENNYRYPTLRTSADSRASVVARSEDVEDSADKTQVFVKQKKIQEQPQSQKVEKKNLYWFLRVLVIAGGLGYFGYESFLKETPSVKKEVIGDIRVVFPQSLSQQQKPNPKLSEDHYQKGVALYVLDHVTGYKEAARYFIKAAESDPENIKAFSLLASCYINLIDSSNKDDHYFSVLSKLIEVSKSKQITLQENIIAESEFLTMMKRPDSAITLINEYTKNNPNFSVSLYYYLAAAFYDKGDFNKAAQYLAQYPDSKAFSPRVFLLKGILADTLGDTDQALSILQQGLKLFPHHALSHLELVKLLSKKGKLIESKSSLQYLLNHTELLSSKNLATTYVYFAKLSILNNDEQSAQMAYQRAIRLDPKNHSTLLEYYTLKARSGDLSEKAKNEAKMFFYLGEGERALLEGNQQEALNQFLSAKKAEPKSFWPALKLGDMFFRQKDTLNARENYQEALKLSPDHIEIGAKYIQTLIESYEWDEAQKVMDHFRKTSSQQSAIDRLAGDFYAKQKRPKEASDFYKKAMMRESIDPDVYISYAELLMTSRNYRESTYFYTLAQRLDPANPYATIGIAKAIAQTDSIQEGIQTLQDQLMKSSHHRAEYLTAIAELQLQKGEVELAQKFLNQAREISPDYSTPWKVQAQIYLSQENTVKGSLDKALAAYQSYSDRNRSDPSGYMERFKIFIKKSEFTKAEEELSKIYEIYPKYPNLHYHKGGMYSVMGNSKAAFEEFEIELKNNPNNIAALIYSGKSLAQMGQNQEALARLNKAMELDPRNAQARLEAANTNTALKNYQGAIALYKLAAELDPGNPLVYKKMGICYREMGDSASAAKAFKKYLQMEPDAPDKSDYQKYQ